MKEQDESIANTQKGMYLAFQLKNLIASASAGGVNACYEIIKKTISQIENKMRTKAFKCLKSLSKPVWLAQTYKNMALHSIRLGDGHLYLISAKNPAALFLGHEEHANEWYKSAIEQADC